jgi:hypothetical protein
MSGIRTSITTTDGRSRTASRIASAPVEASPANSTPSSVESRAAIPRRTTGWSSASSTRSGATDELTR